MEPVQAEFFAQLYRKYFNQIKTYIMSFVSDPHLAEEITQDTFHTAMQKIDAVMAAEVPIAWLKKTAKYKVLNEQRNRTRYLKHFLSLEDAGAFQFSAGATVDDSLVKNEELNQQKRFEKQFYGDLTPDEYLLLQRVIIDHAAYIDVAEELGISLWTCQKRVQQLRKKLKEKILSVK